MSVDSAGPPQIACVPVAIPERERSAHFKLVRSLFGNAAIEREWNGDRLRIRFPFSDLGRLERFVENERRCCCFLDFTLSAAPGRQDVWLLITRPGDAREIIETHFTETKGERCRT